MSKGGEDTHPNKLQNLARTTSRHELVHALPELALHLQRQHGRRMHREIPERAIQFPGRQALLQQRQTGPAKRLLQFRLLDWILGNRFD